MSPPKMKREQFSLMTDPPNYFDGQVTVDMVFRHRKLTVQFYLANIEVIWDKYPQVSDAELEEIWIWSDRLEEFVPRWLRIEADEKRGTTAAELITPIGEALQVEQFEQDFSEFWLKLVTIVPLMARQEVDFYRDNEEVRACGFTS